MRVWLSESVRFASTHRVSSSPVIRQRAVTARRIEAMARHGLPQLGLLAGDSAGDGRVADDGGAGEGRGTPPAEGGGGAALGGSGA
jgi:hypothetical protein